MNVDVFDRDLLLALATMAVEGLNAMARRVPRWPAHAAARHIRPLGAAALRQR